MPVHVLDAAAARGGASDFDRTCAVELAPTSVGTRQVSVMPARFGLTGAMFNNDYASLQPAAAGTFVRALLEDTSVHALRPRNHITMFALADRSAVMLSRAGAINTNTKDVSGGSAGLGPATP